ncbi:MAG: hypothetical protein IPK97_10265 [Ahniella sp.]|nr:hypothetical protein [Ahniella sp.]
MTEFSHAVRRPSPREPQARTTRFLALGISSLDRRTSAGPDEESVELDTLRVEDRTIDTNPHAENEAPYKSRTSGDTRRQTPIAETPATISVITQAQIKESGNRICGTLSAPSRASRSVRVKTAMPLVTGT